ncbi:MAG: 4Fe-4S dicluster domain-containing protein [Deltaproteobacteria bacterium]|nr:4Fe-4S dicluster domain-containing protein [Deltaproteobacteria bacterium]MBW2019013.1 4Fe-4S dicluster domain-containing protein [Deltaproteobacteria bacterium]MBW2073603.1 4Fe-4S dicluster domain-containing protein [Deltaproteobacteria bacterium]RLB82684.1 MAG: 4Fe-4S ferredoxin [Deltaproteobacteria bacterium]
MKRKIAKGRFSAFLNSLKASYRLYGPVRQGDIIHFMPIQDASQIDLSFQNSRLSPKFLFLPQSDRMFEYSLDPARDDAYILNEVPKDDSPRAVIGIRPCDARAFKLVDVNFDTPRFRDPWWVRAREATTLVGLGCTAPCSTCFCTSVGGGPFDETGLDVLLTDTGEAFLAKILTQKGTSLFQTAEAFEDTEENFIEKALAIQKRAEAKTISRVDTSRLADLDTLALYEADFWEEVHFACINCGVCTYLCPTCWCFDIQDETYGRAGIRIRNWDSCMFPLFTLHASGHNPRGQKIHRVRQRFMHKLKYYVDKYKNGVACVGCGRCVQHCPVNIDIREVCRMMNECKR